MPRASWRDLKLVKHQPQDTELQFLNCSKGQCSILVTTSPDPVPSSPCHDEIHPKTRMLWPRGNTFLPESAWSRERNQEPTSPRHPSSWAGWGQRFQRAPSSFLQLLCESSQLKLLSMDTVRAGLQITAPNSCWHVWGEAGTEHLVGSTGSITQSKDGKSAGMSPGHTQQHNHGCATLRLHTNTAISPKFWQFNRSRVFVISKTVNKRLNKACNFCNQENRIMKIGKIMQYKTKNQKELVKVRKRKDKMKILSSGEPILLKWKIDHEAPVNFC